MRGSERMSDMRHSAWTKSLTKLHYQPSFPQEAAPANHEAFKMQHFREGISFPIIIISNNTPNIMFLAASVSAADHVQTILLSFKLSKPHM